MAKRFLPWSLRSAPNYRRLTSMTNGQNAVMSGAKHRLNLISNTTLTTEQIDGHKDWILEHLKFYIEEYNFTLNLDNALFGGEPILAREVSTE